MPPSFAIHVPVRLAGLEDIARPLSPSDSAMAGGRGRAGAGGSGRRKPEPDPEPGACAAGTRLLLTPQA